jgi:hypothetical protein
VAVVLWALVASEPQLSTFETVQVEYKNLPPDLEIGSEPSNTVSLELRGPSGELHALGEAPLRPSVILDMSNVAPGERTFPVSGAVRLARGVHLVRAIPPEVRFSFERRAERDVPVRVRFTGEGQHGYSVASTRAYPDRLKIEGPASRVARIISAITDAIDVSQVVGTSSFRVYVSLEDPYVRIENSPQVEVTVTMKKN